MTLSSTASLWALPTNVKNCALPKSPSAMSETNIAGKKSCKSVLVSRSQTTNGVQTGRSTQQFVVEKERTEGGYFATTPDFVERAERARKLAMMHHPEQFKLLLLKEAAPLWLKEKDLHKKRERTMEAYRLYVRNLIKHFGDEQLCSLHIGHFMTYQQARMAESGLTKSGKPKKAPCASYVNHELNTLAQILKRADLWDLIEKHYRPLPIGNWTPPKVLSPDDEERFFRIAASNPDWKIAYCACSITNNTSAYGTELRNLKMKDVFMDHKPPKFHVPDDKVKNEFRARVIPLNEIAEERMRRIIAVAKVKGANSPEHYIFPKRIKRNQWDVTQPGSPSFIRHAFKEMREAMGPGFEWLCPRNFRNQLITKLFEGGEPDETITSIAGHQTIKMSRYYSRIRIDRKFEALSALVPKKKSVQNAG